jgi:hypothetical protein
VYKIQALQTNVEAPNHGLCAKISHFGRGIVGLGLS